ncbi:hypothetical protein ABZ348_32125 [Streptomyces sp. NPDC005963]|uniref:hypothetical protein n=1 Tax=Streptomyces sp. NPDC005963 TaxID=3156721 RepID=UPI0033D957A8
MPSGSVHVLHRPGERKAGDGERIRTCVPARVERPADRPDHAVPDAEAETHVVRGED